MLSVRFLRTPVKGHNLKTIAIVQARMGSIRFPNKVMQPISGVSMIELLLCRLAKAQQIDQIVLATTEDPRNVTLVEHVRKLGYAVYPVSYTHLTLPTNREV